MTKPQIIIITGDLESGKTSLCLELADDAKRSGFKVCGLVSPGVFSRGIKKAIDVQDLSTGKRQQLAELRDQNVTNLDTKRWSFNTGAVSWVNQILQNYPATDLLIIDELGPLEFDRGEGWIEAFGLIDREEFRAAILVIRPSLVLQATQKWEIARVIDLSGPDAILPSSQALLASLDLQD